MLQSSQTEKRSVSMRILSEDQIWEIREPNTMILLRE